MDTTINSNIIPYDDEELIAFEDTDNAINMLFIFMSLSSWKMQKEVQVKPHTLVHNFWMKFFYTRSLEVALCPLLPWYCVIVLKCMI